ncbi:TniB family NTP-binding protein [[Actinomadura] parvosata]|uniref:TniB family NTP-binding protein n=1 Tax=[Actinomadura] parvosata TaxID=1955412 RepID=UPI00406D0210
MVTPAGGPSSIADFSEGIGWRQAPAEDEWQRQLTTLEGWRQFTRYATQPPELLPTRQWEKLDNEERFLYDEHRLDYHTRMDVVATSLLRQVVHAGRRLTLLNRHAISARRGLVLSGAAGTGKTTAMTQFGKTHEAIDQRRHPEPLPRGARDRIPVVYVTVPPAATARMLAVEFARFLGIPVTSRANITDVIETVCGVMIDTRSTLVCVDEIHNLRLSTRNGAEVSDTLKYFSERIPATFLYAGINVEREGLFTGTRGQQIAGRFSLITTAAFPYADEWKAVVATLESALRLHRHRSGALQDLDYYLHQRTGGMIGSLSHLIRGAAIEVILNGNERIDRKALELVDLDHAAQSKQAKPTRRPHKGNA